MENLIQKIQLRMKEKSCWKKINDCQRRVVEDSVASDGQIVCGELNCFVIKT